MRKILFLITLVLTSISRVYSQEYLSKPSIDTSDFSKWEYLLPRYSVSNDGQYVIFRIKNSPARSQTLVVKSVNSDWERQFVGISIAEFSIDSRKMIFKNGNDSLCILGLGSDSINYISDVKSYQIFTRDRETFLAYKVKYKPNSLIISSMTNGRELSFLNVGEFFLNRNGDILVIKREAQETDSLFWVDLLDRKTNYKEHNFWNGSKSSSIIFDDSGRRIAFIVSNLISNSLNQKTTDIYYYQFGQDKGTVILGNELSGNIDNSCTIELVRFSHDGTNIFYNVNPIRLEAKPSEAMVNVWSYKDPKLQSQQLYILNNNSKSYLSVFNIKSHKKICIQRDDDDITFFEGKSDEVVFLTTNAGENTEKEWSTAARPQFSLLFTKSGMRVPLKMDLAEKNYKAISGNGKFIILKDDIKGDLFSYSLETGNLVNLTQNISVDSSENKYSDIKFELKDFDLAGWLNNDDGILIYDKYDIWKLDIYGLKNPINLTNGYGRRMKITLHFLEGYLRETFDYKREYILTAFNRITKENGFYSITFKDNKELRPLFMGPYVFYSSPEGRIANLSGYIPQRAGNGKVYVLVRQSSRESPNLYLTSDFKKFKRLSFINPEIRYNWITAELTNFKTVDGKSVSGVMYKPENFDSTKKYPIIFHYYEMESNRLNLFIRPESFQDNINIPFLVSRGYIVFRPDIYYKIGEPGQSAYNSVVGAALYLTEKYKWIDKSRMGLQAHSMGGFETNYIITHSTIFAAACSACGISNVISGSEDVSSNGISNLGFYEHAQVRLGKSLWEDQDVYINNSPIFKANSITTPLLLMSNRNDGAVSFTQGLAFFTSLRRLNKKVWMLEYDNEGHSLLQSKNRLDYTLRVTQFFDYYLRGKMPPSWMVNGIRASDKGLKSGLQFESKDSIP